MSFKIERHMVEKNRSSTETTYIDKTKIYIGSGPGDDIYLDDLKVSLDHATIESVGNIYILKDTDSTHGTYVNQQRVKERHLANNDEIHIASYTLRISLSAPENPIEIVVEQADANALVEKWGKVAYLEKYRLSSSFFTKSLLPALCVIVALGSTVIAIALGKAHWGWFPKVFLAPGKVAASHHQFERDCAQCHTGALQKVADETCQRCHNTALHHANQVATPGCATCHVEHRGRQRSGPAIVDSQFCTQCHADLHTTEGTLGPLPRFASRIRSFTTDHPQFAVHEGIARVRLSGQANLQDTAQVKLNHKVHLKPGLMALEGPESLTCRNCHQVDAQGAYMRSITYGEHCMRCHLLEFDERFPQQIVPHGKQPEEMRKFLRDNFTRRCVERLVQPPSSPQEGGERALDRHHPGQPEPRAEAETVVRYSDAGVREAEKRLYTGGKQSLCGLCHILPDLPPGGLLPKVVQPAIPARWLPHSVFNHQAHARVGHACEDCHRKARESEKTTDVLLPGIASCQECHSVSGGVDFACVTCHLYHNRTESKREM